MSWEWVLLPTVGAGIGWVTNWVAVRMLFRPRRPLRVPILGVEVQGVLPRRHAQIARIIGETVERDLLSADTLVDVLRSGNYREQVLTSVSEHLERRMSSAVSRFLPPGMQTSILRFVREWVVREVDQMLGHVEEGLADRIREQVSVAQLVEERILNFDLDELERLVIKVASTELRHIELLGAVLGGAIGLIQAALLAILNGVS